MKISLLHPSRNRPQKGLNAILQWLNYSSQNVEIEYILSLDDDDSYISEYQINLNKLENEFKVHKKLNTKLILGQSNYVVAATNRAAEQSTGDILIFMADDFEAPLNWDEQVLDAIHHSIAQKISTTYNVFEGNLQEFIKDCGKVALLVEDNCNKNYNLLTLPIITREFYNSNGYFFHPNFKSMFCDNFIYEQAVRSKTLFDARNIIFTHRHYTNTNEQFRGTIDETYIRSNNLYEEGKITFNQLALENGWEVKY